LITSWNFLPSESCFNTYRHRWPQTTLSVGWILLLLYSTGDFKYSINSRCGCKP